MRIISGSSKGCKLFTLEGDNTRPTSDRAKEALFNILQDLQGKAFLDLFGGSGSVGLEAASRGANVTIVEKDLKSFGIIEKNLAKTKLNNVKLKRNEAIDFLNLCGNSYDYIFLDPPYKSNLIIESIKKIIEKGLLHSNGLIIAEVDSKDDTVEEMLNHLDVDLQIIDKRKYGRNKFLFIQINAKGGNDGNIYTA